MSIAAVHALIGTALVDHDFCEKLLGEKPAALLAEFDLTDWEREAILVTEADSIHEFATKLYDQLIAK